MGKSYYRHAHRPSRYEWEGKRWDWYIVTGLAAFVGVLLVVVIVISAGG